DCDRTVRRRRERASLPGSLEQGTWNPELAHCSLVRLSRVVLVLRGLSQLPPHPRCTRVSDVLDRDPTRRGGVERSDDDRMGRLRPGHSLLTWQSPTQPAATLERPLHARRGPGHPIERCIALVSAVCASCGAILGGERPQLRRDIPEAGPRGGRSAIL